MNDFEIFKKCIVERLDKLEYKLINSGSGCEMGCSPEFIKEQIKITREELIGI